MKQPMRTERDRDHKSFWNRYSRFYDFEINRFSGQAYAAMYGLMAELLNDRMDVLEVATGTGLIACHIAPFVRHIEATDFSPKMIEAAKRKRAPKNLRFSVEEATALSFAESTFDAAVISNALHIMPDPAKALAGISRTLKPKGLLIAPTYSHGHLKDSTWNLSAAILRLIGFETYAKWTPEEYVAFIAEHGFAVERWQILRAAFPLVFLVARKK